ncbi:FSH1-domain-containing protein [Xylona heveae TC161]|uniref:FSH1-domain-containing protein n=1 Tax=Xylona heveae (strain CBS 132557 / TC161) TaxID=1328760 RepID=A0A164ZMS4_XYLHT|nr:FSH1-domain-containing protein [Xylona heveae TC161]KZF19289.1 FSH1-domain-containing protein [Xylona heveae TC161]
MSHVLQPLRHSTAKNIILSRPISPPDCVIASSRPFCSSSAASSLATPQSHSLVLFNSSRPPNFPPINPSITFSQPFRKISMTTGNSAAPPANGTTEAGPKKLKALMLHGYTQSGPLFHAKTRALEKTLQKAFPAAPAIGHVPSHPGGIELVYPTGPTKLRVSDIPGYDVQGATSSSPGEEPEAYGWWRKNDETGEYIGLERGLAHIGEVLKTQGPFAGVIGFSQGGAATGMIASLLEPGRKEAFAELAAATAGSEKAGIEFPPEFDPTKTPGFSHPPLKFAASYSGFAAPDARYKAFYQPKIYTPLLHVMGSLDTVVEEKRVRTLIDASTGKEEERVIVHPGGHFLPSQKQYVNALIGFIRQSLAKAEAEEEEKAGRCKKNEEESVEDMDVPF